MRNLAIRTLLIAMGLVGAYRPSLAQSTGTADDMVKNVVSALAANDQSALSKLSIDQSEFKKDAGRAFGFVQLTIPASDQLVTRTSFHFKVDKPKLRQAADRDGHYLLRSNLTAEDPAVLWTRYIQLTQIEAAFRSLKNDLGLRPIYHRLDRRVEAHIFVAFLAYCLQVALKNRLQIHAPGLSPTAVLEKRATIQMIDVWIPTQDQRWLILPRYTQPSSDLQILLEKLHLALPAQPPPRIKTPTPPIPSTKAAPVLW